MHPEQILQQIEQLHSLPALPMVVQTLTHDIQTSTSRMDQIARLLTHDQALTARILRLANSPFYATREPVRSVSHALPLLGLRTVATLLMKVGLFDQAQEARGFWLHALGTACAARAVARVSGLDRLDVAFTVGLLHDIGKLALRQTLPEQAAAVAAVVQERGCLIREAETAVLGLDHCRIGLVVAKRWSLPPECVAAIGQHHSVAAADERTRPWAACAHVADILARAMLIGNGGDQGIPILDPAAMDSLRLDRSRFDDLFTTAEEELSLAEVFFNILDDGSGAPHG